MVRLFFFPLILLIVFKITQGFGMESSLESLSFEGISSLIKSKHIPYSCGPNAKETIKLEIDLNSHRSLLEGCKERLPEFELIDGALGKWKECLDKGEALLSCASDDLCTIQSKILLETLEMILNTKYLEKRYIFSGTSNKAISLASVPLDFNGDEDISQYYSKENNIQPSLCLLTKQKNFKVDIVYTQPVFENLVRGVMLCTLRKINKNNNHAKMEFLVKNAKKDFEINQWKAKHYLETVLQELEMLKLETCTLENKLKKNYILSVREKEENDRRIELRKNSDRGQNFFNMTSPQLNNLFKTKPKNSFFTRKK